MKNKYPGKLITIEGMEGVGKSTAMKFLQEYLKQKQIPLVCTREPGGTPLAEQMRQILLMQDQEILTLDSELFLLFAARAQHVELVIKPALERGDWVLCDRFVDASYAYQGGGRHIAKYKIATLEKWVLGNLKPDLTLLLVAPIKIALQRARMRGNPDRFENETRNFFARVQSAYLDRARSDPKRFRIINANRDKKIVQQNLIRVVDSFVEQSRLG